jgi:hypothetical protein
MQRFLFFVVVLSVILTACSSNQIKPSSSALLDDFPLELGATWKYAASISYQDPKDSSALAVWTGIITRKVVDKKIISGDKITFTIEETLEPNPPQGVWRISNSHEYAVEGNGVYYQGNSAKIYQYPLSDNLSWAVFQDSNLPLRVQYIGDVTTLYGTLHECYLLTIFSKIDLKEDVFCSGFGFVESNFRSFNGVQTDVLELISFESGK